MTQGTTLDFEEFMNPDLLARNISAKYDHWRAARAVKEEEWRELRNYMFATNTRTTSNSSNPWKNSTTRPKLAQIRDNLHSNYFSSLFPNGKWLRWEADDAASAGLDKRTVIANYIETKLRQSDFEVTMSKLIYDYIDYGNAFATVEFVNDSYFNEETQETISNYVGPKLVRLSPFDLVFNPRSPSFEMTPKILRSVHSLGELKRKIDKLDQEEYKEVFNKLMSNRTFVRNAGSGEYSKSDGYCADGFGSIQDYYNSDEIEVLTFFGDIYDEDNDVLYENYEISIVDRAYIIKKERNQSWFGKAPMFHVGWRHRPDNLYAMGPMDNLVGLQYRMDHLENLRADAFDSIAFPRLKIIGDVDDWEDRPGARIYIDGEGDVQYLAPDTTALQADFQIAELERTMEEMAGAPRQAMGIRTPGEKTAFEVQQLQNATGRIFQNKTEHFERLFVEPIINNMLELSRRKMDYTDVIRVVDDETGALLFSEVTKEDITAKGKIRPIGARHFAQRAQKVQNLQQLHQIKLSDPTVGVHMSGKEFARLLATELGEDSLYQENVGVFEQTETQQIAQEAGTQAEIEQEAGLEIEG